MHRSVKTTTWILLTASFAGVLFVPGIEGQPDCPKDPGTAVYEVASSCIQGLLQGFNYGKQKFPTNFYDIEGWKTHCNASQLVSCYEDKFEGCEEGYVPQMLQHAWEQVHRKWREAGFFPSPGSCDGDVVRSNVTQLYSAVSQECRELVAETVDMCLDDWLEEVNIGEPLDQPHIKRWATSTYQCGVGRTPSQCGEEGRDLARFLLDQCFPPAIRTRLTEQDLDQPVSSNELLSIDRSTVGVFGDPHMQVFKHSQLQTCIAEGTTVLLANEYFKMEGTSSFVAQSRSMATSLTALKVTFLEGDIVYFASGGSLPSTLSNGLTTAMAGQHMVDLTEVHRDYRVALQVPSMGVVMTIRRWGSYFFFTLRASDVLYKKSYGLLVSGCGSKDMIDISVNQPSRRRRSPEAMTTQCQAACVNVTNVDGYKFNDACVFDCTTTENMEIVAMSAEFQEAVEEVKAKDSDLDLRNPDDDPSGADALSFTSVVSIVFTVTTGLMLSQ